MEHPFLILVICLLVIVGVNGVAKSVAHFIVACQKGNFWTTKPGYVLQGMQVVGRWIRIRFSRTLLGQFIDVWRIRWELHKRLEADQLCLEDMLHFYRTLRLAIMHEPWRSMMCIDLQHVTLSRVKVELITRDKIRRVNNVVSP